MGDVKRILAVDDDDDVLKLIADELEMIGLSFSKCTVECVRNAQHALERINEEEYDLILTDYMMPKMNGLSLIEQVRAGSNSNATTPIICISGILPKSEQNQHNLKGVHFLYKPFDLGQLEALVRKTLLHPTQ